MCFGTSLQITDEVGGYLLVALTFLSMSVAEAHGAFHRVEFVQMRLSPSARIDLADRLRTDVARGVRAGDLAIGPARAQFAPHRGRRADAARNPALDAADLDGDRHGAVVPGACCGPSPPR